MFIQTEATPNPTTLKFLPGRPVLEAGTFEARNAAEAEASPLAKALMELPGVGGVRIEAPAIDLVFQQPRELLGDLANSRAHAALLWTVTFVLLASGVYGMYQYLT